jgi:hypothetical protein
MCINNHASPGLEDDLSANDPSVDARAARVLDDSPPADSSPPNSPPPDCPLPCHSNRASPGLEDDLSADDPSVDASPARVLADSPPASSPPPHIPSPGGSPPAEACVPNPVPLPMPEPAIKRHRHKKHNRERTEDPAAPHSRGTKGKRHKGMLQCHCFIRSAARCVPWSRVHDSVQLRGWAGLLRVETRTSE